MTARGGARAEPPLTRLVEVLDDGQWHLFDDVVREVGKTIPPGRAIRQTERGRLAAGGPPVRAKEVPVERQIESGRRSIVRAILGTKRAREYFELDPPMKAGTKAPPETRIRMVQVPAAVVRDRKLDSEGRLVNDALLDRLVAAEDPRELLLPFDERRTMENVALALIERLKDPSGDSTGR